MFYRLLSIFFCLHLFMVSSYVRATPASQASFILIKDVNSGAVFYEKDADKPLFPSSMTKIMTAYIVFHRLHNRQLDLDDKFIVSEKAWKTKGSSMFLNVGEIVSVRDLLLGALVQSGNDACIALAEGVSGSEEAFVEEMNRVAKELGCTNTRFTNCTGWPSEDHYTTAHDLYIMAFRTIQDFPKLYKEFYAVPEYTYNKIRQPNLNPLIGKELNVDGFKTGHTDAGGYGIVISGEHQKDQRIIVVVNGLSSKKERAQESMNLYTWAYRNFRTYQLAKKGEPLETAPIWLGDKTNVELICEQDVYYSIHKSDIQNLKVEVHMKAPIAAPIQKGKKLAELVISGSKLQGELRIPLFAAESVGTIGFWGRITEAFHYLVFGHSKPKTQE